MPDKRGIPRLDPYKVGLALVSGWLAFFLSRSCIVIDNIYQVKLIWSLLFPLAIAIAMEPVYAYITGIFGLAIFIPFYLSPDRGLANILDCFFYLLLLVLNGHLVRNRGKKRFVNTVYFVQLVFSIAFYGAFELFYDKILFLNSTRVDPDVIRFISPMILRIQSINFIFAVVMLVSIVNVVLLLPQVRRFYRLEPIPYSKKVRDVLLLTIFVMVTFMLLDYFIETFYFASRGIHVSVFSSSSGRYTKLTMIVAAAFILCNFIIVSTGKQEAAQAELAKSEEKYRWIFENMIDTNFEVDKEGIILKVSPSVQNTFGYSTAEMEGKPLKLFIDQGHLIDPILENLFLQKQFANYEVIGRQADGQSCNLLMSGIIVPNGHGGEDIAVITARNVTEEKKAEKTIMDMNQDLERIVTERTNELKLAYDDLESFSYTVAHEIKTPIREIDTYAMVLHEDNLDVLSEQSIQDMASIRRICNQTIDMAQKMMEYSKVGYSVINSESIPMRQLVLDCYEEVKRMSRTDFFNLHVFDLPDLIADKFLLRQAIINILSNSVKFAKPDGKVFMTVGCMLSDDQQTYYFKDNGVGFDAQGSEKLFGLFNRSHNNNEFEGNGIGLATVKRVVERNGGSVRIYGEVGKGCVVFLTFSSLYPT